MPNEVKQLENGRISAKLEDGTVFEGDPLEVTTKLAEAKMNTVRWGQEWKQKAEAVQPVQPTPATTQPPVDANEKQLQEYLLNQTAKALGYNSGEEYKADLAKVKGTTESLETNNAITQFFTNHPEYPGTQDANDVIGKIMEERGWSLTAGNLEAAHLVALDLHKKDAKQGYEPLTAEQINAAWANNMAAASRQAPPPMLSGNNPELAGGAMDNPYAVPLDQLRKDAIRKQLEGGR